MSGLFLDLTSEFDDTDSYNSSSIPPHFAVEVLQAFLPLLVNSSDMSNDLDFGIQNGSMR